MDKAQAYAGQIPLDTYQFNLPQRNVDFAVGFLLRAVFGTSTVADGLTCIPTSPASLSVNVGPGSIIFSTTVDTVGSGFGSLTLDNSTPLVKMGINTGTTLMGPFSVPGTAGQSQNYLIQASFSEADGSPVTLPYVNPNNPLQPYSGPNNSGSAQNTKRVQTVTLQIKNGVAATTGSQTTPAPDAGNVGIWVVTLTNGNTTITSGNITAYLGAPFIPSKLGVGSNFGFSHATAYSSGTNLFVVPNGVTTIEVELWGGGGGGGGALNTGCAAIGGSAGGYARGIYTVTPGVTLTGIVGAAGAGGIALGGNGSTGGTSSFGGFLSGGGGGGSAGASAGIQTTGTGAVGVGVGGTIWNKPGLPGTVGFVTGNVSLLQGGSGGASAFFSALSGSVSGAGPTAINPGCGGGGASANAAGGAGGAGYIIVRW